MLTLENEAQIIAELKADPDPRLAAAWEQRLATMKMVEQQAYEQALNGCED